MRVIQAACDKLLALIKSGDAAVKKQARRSFVCLFSCFITDVASVGYWLSLVLRRLTAAIGTAPMHCQQQDVDDDEGISK